MKILTRHFRKDGRPPALTEYRAAGGYQSLKIAFAMTPDEIIAMIEEAELLGRGGAGFPCGMKWRLRGMDAPKPRYLICNLDESEPGTFKDRSLLYGNPHQLIEGMIVSAYALQVEHVFAFIRGEYEQGAKLLMRAMAEARDADLLGHNIIGSGFNMKLEVHISAGRYICGEETAQINAMEGRRPNPRYKVPHPSKKGLWGKPTTTNNAETLANVPYILIHGAEWFRSLGVNGGSGPKLYCVSGKVKQPGLFELPMGTAARKLIFDHAGGLEAGRSLLGFLPGGASTPFLGPEHLDVPMDFDPVAQAGSRLGTGALIVLDDTTCPVRTTLNLMRFFARESCGFCTPCRDGFPYVVDIMERIEQGKACMDDLDLLQDLCGKIGPHTFCVFAPGGIMPLKSSLRCFRDIYEQHIHASDCPFGSGWRA